MLPYKVGLRKNFIENVQSIKVTEMFSLINICVSFGEKVKKDVD